MAKLEEDLVTDGHLERLHAALVQALRTSRRAPFEQPVTVAEIYQDLVPYRIVRVELGFDLNADYEHTLLRLLSGEGDLARLDPVEAARELREELDSPNPNVGLFRKFAGCDVWVTPPADEDPESGAVSQWARQTEDWRARGDETRAQPEPAGSGPLSYDPIAVSRPADRAPAAEAGDAASPLSSESGTPGAADGAEAAVLEVEHPAGDEFRDSDALAPSDSRAEPLAEDAAEADEPEYELVPVQRRNSAVATENAAHCAFCDARLPSHRMLRFCPFCGTDQAHLPCSSCGEAIEPGWRFCIACGSAAPEQL